MKEDLLGVSVWLQNLQVKYASSEGHPLRCHANSLIKGVKPRKFPPGIINALRTNVRRCNEIMKKVDSRW